MKTTWRMIIGRREQHHVSTTYVTQPGPLTPAQEKEIEARRVVLSKIFDDFTDESGVQEINLPKEESRGLKKLQYCSKEARGLQKLHYCSSQGAKRGWN